MTARIIDGTAVAKSVRAELAREAAALAERHGRPPGLGVILVGEDPASQSYVKGKDKACAEAGFRSEVYRYPADAAAADVFARIDALNRDPAFDGILVQLPLPGHIDGEAVLRAIDPAKDVDGFHPENVARLALGQDGGFVPCTPMGISVLLEREGVETRGKFAVVIGRSNIVGRPMAQLLMRKGKGGDATVCVCHSRSERMADICRQADILIAAIGKARFVPGDWIKPGAAVIDVGVNRVDDPSKPKGYRLVGDVDYEAALGVAGAITPVPGGVGPMTIAMLLHNTLASARRRLEKCKV